MTVEIRAVQVGDAEALHRFFAAVPNDDRTFFKEDLSDPGRVAQRWITDEHAIRRLVLDSGGSMVAFATLSPGAERMSHVADLRLVVAASARGRGHGRSLARGMLLEALRHGYKKVTVDIAVDNQGAIAMFRDLGFEPEALLRDQLRDAEGGLHDIVLLAHLVDEQWSGMLTAGLDDAVR